MSVNPDKPVGPSNVDPVGKPPEASKLPESQAKQIPADVKAKITIKVGEQASLKDKQVSVDEGTNKSSGSSSASSSTMSGSSSSSAAQDADKAAKEDVSKGSSVAAQAGQSNAVVKGAQKPAGKSASWGDTTKELKNLIMKNLNFKDVREAQLTNKEFHRFSDKSPFWTQLANLLHVNVQTGVRPKSAVLARLGTNANEKSLNAINNRFIAVIGFLKILGSEPALKAIEEMEKQPDTYFKYGIAQNFCISYPRLASAILGLFGVYNSEVMLGVEGLTDLEVLQTLLRVLPRDGDLPDLKNLFESSCFSPADSKVAFQQELCKALIDKLLTSNNPSKIFEQLFSYLPYAPKGVAESLISALKQGINVPAEIIESFVHLFVQTGSTPGLVKEFLRHSDLETQNKILANLEQESLSIRDTARTKRGMDLLIGKVFPLVGERVRNKVETYVHAHSYVQTGRINYRKTVNPDCYFKSSQASPEELEKALVAKGLPVGDVQRILKDLGTIEEYEQIVSNTIAIARQLVLEAQAENGKKQEDVKKDA